MKNIRYALIFCILSTPVFAGFIKNKADWDDLSEDQKSGYVIGIFDQLVTIYTGDSDSYKQIKRELHLCAAEQRLNSDSLITLINKGYDDVSTWTYPPNLHEQLCKVCVDACNK